MIPCRELSIAAIALGGLLFQAAPQEELPAKVYSIVGLARTLPGDYAADGLLWAARLSKGSAAVLLADEAFGLAVDAHEPFPRKSGFPLDSKAAQEDAASQQLNRLELQVKAVKRVLDVNAVDAQQRFSRISLDMPKAQCGAFLDASSYYDLAAQVFKSFSKEQRAREADLVFAQRVVGSVRSSEQLRSALRFAASIERDLRIDGDFGAVSLRLADALQHDSAWDKHALTNLDSITYGVMRLISKHPELRTILTPALRIYVLEAGALPRCKGSPIFPTDAGLRSLNRVLCGSAPRCSLSVSSDDIPKPKQDSEWRKAGLLWQDPVSRAAHLRLRQLVRDRPPEGAYSAAEWKGAVRTLTDQVSRLSQTGSDAVYPLEKAILFRRLYTVVDTEDELKIFVLRNYVEALHKWDGSGRRPPVWGYIARQILSLKSTDMASQAIIADLIDKEPILQLYQAIARRP